MRFKPFNRFAPFKSLNPSNGFKNEFPNLINGLIDLNVLNDLNKF
jgi:hypothetical protein